MSNETPENSGDNEGPNFIDVLDAKLVQYVYGANKLQLLINSIIKLSENLEDPRSLPMLQHMVLLGGNVFSISESAFNEKLNSLGNFIPYKALNIQISSTIGHIPYDSADSPVVPLGFLPDFDEAKRCLKLFEQLCTNALQSYQKRIVTAKAERTKSGCYKSDHFENIQQIVEKECFTDDMDLNVSRGFLFELPKEDSLLKDEQFIETSLVDMDIRMLFSMTNALRTTLSKLKIPIIKLITLKKLPERQRLRAMQQMPNSKYALHQILVLVLRLNDLYTIIRKLGRKIYLSNYQHLHDQRFTIQSKNPTYFKLHLLKEIDEYLNSNKRNGTLIATITRFVRQNSRYEANPKNLVDFINFTNQAHVIIEKFLIKLEEFATHWITCELRFRKTYSLPIANLISIYQEEQQYESRDSTPSNKKTLEEQTENQGNVSKGPSDSSFKGKSGVETQREGDSKPISKNHSVRLSRSSSISSAHSNNSSGRGSVSLGRRSSISSPTNRNTIISPKISHSPRPNSTLFLQGNNLQGNLQQNREQVSPSNGRRRSNSQPIPVSQLHENSNAAATSGAAAALHKKQNNPNTSSPDSIRRSLSLSKRQSTPSVTSPTPTRRKQDLIVVKEEETPKTPRQLVASRRVHDLQDAARAGSIILRQREQLTSVIFDPNCPSETNIRKKIDNRVTTKSSPDTTTEPENTHSRERSSSKSEPKFSLKDEASLLNSEKTPQAQESTSLNISASSLEITEVSLIKKVRFIGVPEYTEAEDAPTKPASKFLRNFAAFRQPTTGNRAFKKRDQLLREESLSFKSQVYQKYDFEQKNINTPLGRSFGSNRLSKLTNKLI
ncbi:uncharacterized protein PRCAT00003618001 [Priceomyces carsonii]|uniref:uncharacterized protein n=1 Tax=Priceomyces carsonii TaxID=28549 RepID=UPI002EDB30F2|nr:unnamed protein product [Priceomyces carsonii]